MTLLTIVQDAADIIGLPRPSAVVNNTDTSARQLLSLSNIGGKILAKRYPWQALIKEATWTTLAAEDQGTIESIAPGFSYDAFESQWNRTQRVRILGPLNSQEWQQRAATSISGPYSLFRFRDKHLYLSPAPAAGETGAFEYISRYWCESSGGTDQERWAADTDVGILDEGLLTLDLIWRFKAAKGFAYGEDFRAFEMEANKAMARDGSKSTLNMSDDPTGRNYSPGVGVPDGSWNL